MLIFITENLILFLFGKFLNFWFWHLIQLCFNLKLKSRASSATAQVSIVKVRFACA